MGEWSWKNKVDENLKNGIRRIKIGIIAIIGITKKRIIKIASIIIVVIRIAEIITVIRVRKKIIRIVKEKWINKGIREYKNWERKTGLT